MFQRSPANLNLVLFPVSFPTGFPFNSLHAFFASFLFLNSTLKKKSKKFKNSKKKR
jgi:hypothetical protein